MIASDWRPDPGKGLFETLLVVGGRAVEPATHLRRLERSLDVLYGLELPGEAAEQLGTAAADLELGRVRLTATPASGRGETKPAVELLIDADEIDPEIVFPARGVRLFTQPLSGGLGPHKLVDRPQQISRPVGDEAGALLLDESEVLEAGWANVFAVRDDTLLTPPLDGRILPGTTRAALVALAVEGGIESAERALSPADLLTADETFLSGSIRGIEAAEELDGEQLPGCGPVSRRLVAALRRRWGLDDSDEHQASASAPKRGLIAR